MQGNDKSIDTLSSWNDGPAKEAIVDFVTRVTTPQSREFVPPEKRIAAFDNDGTLWTEQPMYFQLAFAFDRIKVMSKDHPEWQNQQPFKAFLEDNKEELASAGEKGIVAMLAASHSGMTTEEFAETVDDWLTTARHARFDRAYTEMIFQPMLELLDYLREHGFKTFIVSGGGVEFIRAFAERVYGVPPEQVVGSSGVVKFQTDGSCTLVKEPQVEFVDDGPGKPVGINRFIGRRPILAFGNSDGDQAMLQYTAAGNGARFLGLIHHTDADREWAYDRE